jgi:hypothetical protein
MVSLLVMAPFSVQASAEVKSIFLYNLSNFSGKVPYNEVRLHVDRARDEVYVADRGVVRVYNDSGMEEFWFGDDPALGGIYALAVDEKGDILLLCYDFGEAGYPKFSIVRCNYRGEERERFMLSALPAEFSGFFPNLMFYRDGNFILMSTVQMKAVVTDGKGVFRKGYDFARILEIPEKDRPDTEISGFSLDRAGNMLFTVTVLFKAYVVSPEGKVVASFGKAGSAPGMFGIVSGIVADDLGNYLIVERLRSVVMVFDKEFRFIREFGYRGDKPGNLIRPNDLAMGNSGKLYVTQVRNRGVSVFSLTSD